MPSEAATYPVPWDLLVGLTPHLRSKTREDLTRFVAEVSQRIQPAAEIRGLERLPAEPRFVIAPNHYQRKGLWILQPACVISHAVAQHYGPCEPPVRWVVTANWPPLKVGPWRVPNPGDIFLGRVAHALWCYPVSFAGANPSFTARTIRALLKDARNWTRPLGIFPEGVAGVAGKLSPPLPGVGRVLMHLRMPIVPVAISERGRMVIEFGEAFEPKGDDAADVAMSEIAKLLAR